MADVSDHPLTEDDLERPFAKSGARHELLGTESEKFGVLRATGKPVSYDGRTCGIVQIFSGLLERGDWKPYREREDGPIVALDKVDTSRKMVISLEPGAQLELSGAPVETVHDVETELAEHLADIAPVSAECGIDWLAVGYHPLAKQEQLPWVPKERYAIMREYFEPIDIISVVRHNQKLQRGNWHKAAEEQNFFLRGFNYMFIMKKPSATRD